MSKLDFNEEQLDDMMHALGVNPRMKKLKIYRNHFVINQSESWDDLVEKGLAQKQEIFGQKLYVVTEQGESLISRLTGAKR